MGAETVHTNELRRLEFVKSTSESVFGNTFKVAHAVYSGLRTRIPLPGQVDAGIKTVESKVTEFTAPRLNLLQDAGGDWLTFADGKVDQLVKSADGYKGSALGWLRSKVPDRYVEAKDVYTQKAVDAFTSFKLQDAIAFAKEKSSQSYTIITQAPFVVYVKSKAVVQKATDFASKTVNNIWKSISVDKAIDAVAPTVDFAKQKYKSTHDTIVAAPLYKKTYNGTKGIADYAQSNTLYKLSATHVYPVISPLADPVLVKVQPYADTVFEQLKPIAASA